MRQASANLVRHVQAFDPRLRLRSGARAWPHQEGGVCRGRANFFLLLLTVERKKKTGTVTYHMTGNITHPMLNVLLLSK